MPKRTFQPNTRKAKKKHGFRTRMATKSGQNIIKSRRDKGRKTLTKEMLPQKNRLNKKKDFDAVFKKGKSSFDELLGVKILKNNKQKFSRFGIIVSSKVSKKAVKRNKIKRRIRNIIRKNHLSSIVIGDVVVISLPRVLDKKYSEIEKSLYKHFKKLNFN